MENTQTRKLTKTLSITAIVLAIVCTLLLAILLLTQKNAQNTPNDQQQEQPNDENTGETPDNGQELSKDSYKDDEIALKLPNDQWQMNLVPNEGSFATASTLRTICASIDFKKGSLEDKSLETIINEVYGKTISLDPNLKDRYTVADRETITVGPQNPGEVYTVFFKSDDNYYQVTYLAYSSSDPSDDRATDCKESYPATDFDALLKEIRFN